MFDPFSDSPAPSRSPSPSPWGFNPFFDPTPGIAPAPEPASFAPDPLDDEIAALRAHIAARGTATKEGAKTGNFLKDAPAALIQGGASVFEGFDTLISDFTPFGYGYRKLTGGELKPFETLSNVMGAGAAGLAGYGDGIDPFFNEQDMQREAGSDFMSRQKSDKLLDLQSQRAQNVANAGEDSDGWMGREASKGWAFLKDTFSSPRMMADLVITQIPLMLPSLGAAKLARGLVPVVNKAAMTAAEIAKIEKVSTWASRLAGAAMQGADVSGNTKKDLSKLLESIDEEEARQIPALAEMLSEGMDLDDAKAEYALGHARIAGVLGGLASVISNSIPGIGGGVEDALARIANRGATKVAGNAAGSVLLEALKGAGREVPSELLEEGLGKLVGNYEAQQIDPTRELSSGQGETLAAAAAGAIGTGGATGAFEGFGDQGVSNPTPAIPVVPNAAALAARRAAMTGQPAAVTAKAKPASQFTPTARAVMLAQQNTQAAATRLADLDAINESGSISPDEELERTALVSFIAPDRITIDPKKADIDKKNGVPAALQGIVTAEAQDPFAPSSQVPTSGATAAPPVTPSVQKPVDVGSTPPPAATPDPFLPAAQASTSGDAAVATGATVPTNSAVKPTTAGELRLRVKKANAMLERINRDVPGMKTSAALDKLRTDIATGTVDDKTVAALEKEVADHEASSVAVAQQRALESERQQNERARIAAETKRAAQEKKNAAAVEKLAAAIQREQAKAFKKDPEAVIAELQAERDSTLAAGVDARDIEARIAEFTAKLPAPKPLKSAEAIASDIKAELAAPAPVVPATPVGSPLPQPAAIPLAFGKASFAGPDALGGFNFEGLANGLNQAKQEGKLTPEVVSSLGAQLEAAVTKQVEQSAANKEGGIFGPDGNTSDTRTALAFQMPDGSVVMAGLLVPKKLTSIDGSGRKEEGLRVARMASRGGSGEGKQIKVNGSSPVLLSDLLSAGIFPIDAVRFDEAPGKPLQKFQNRDEYNASIAALNLTQKSAPMVGGDNENSSGGATTVNADGDTQNLDAADAAQQRMAEAEQQTAPKETLAHSQAATEWGVGSDDQVVRLWNKLVDSGGKMSDVRTKKLKSLLGWLDEATKGIDNADLALERIFENSPTVEAFAENGRDPANWIAKVTDSTQAPKPVALAQETKPLAIDVTPSPAALPAATTPETVGLTPASIEQVWKRVNDTGDVMAALAKMQASESAKVQAIIGELLHAKIGPQEITDALAVAKKAKAEKKTSKADTRTLEQRLEAAQVAAFVKVLSGEGKARERMSLNMDRHAGFTQGPSINARYRVDGGDTLSGNEPLKTGTGAEGAGSSGLQSGTGIAPGVLAENLRRAGASAQGTPGRQQQRVRSEQAALASSGLPEIAFPATADNKGFEHKVVVGGVDRVLKFTSNHENIPHGFKTIQAFRNGGGELVTRDSFGDRQADWRKKGVTLGSATPAEYADRWQLFNDVFGDDVRVEGYSRRPDGSLGLVVSQQHVLGRPTSEVEMVNYLHTLGFEQATNPHGLNGWSWIRHSDDVVLADVKPDNFRTDDKGRVHALDVVTGVVSNLRVPGADTTPAQQAERTGDTQRIIDRLRPFVNVTRVARIIGNDNATGKAIDAGSVVIALNDVAFHSNVGLVTTIHEVGHSLLEELPIDTQNSVIRAATRSLDTLRKKASADSKRTGVKVATNIKANIEETLVEATAQELTAEGIAEPQAIAATLWRAVKDIYFRAARALLAGLGAPQEQIDAMALAWWENTMRRRIGGDFDRTAINLLERFTPAIALQDADARFGYPSTARYSIRELDIAPEVAADRIEGAVYNATAPVIAKLKDSIAPGMDNEAWWKLIGVKNPEAVLSGIEERTPGSSSFTINGDGMNTAMNQAAQKTALQMMQGIQRKVIARVASATKSINTASDNLLTQRNSVAKTEAEYRDASVLDGNLRDGLRKMTSDLMRSVDRNEKLAGELGKAIAEANADLPTGELPEGYQSVLSDVLDGKVALIDYLSAMSKLGTDIRSGGRGVTVRQIQTAVRAAASTDSTLAALVANRPLFTVLSVLAHQSAREMGLLQLRQFNQTSNQMQAAAIKAEMNAIRTASDEALDKMWEDMQASVDQSSLSARLKVEYLKERRALRRINSDIKKGMETLRIMDGVNVGVRDSVDGLEKAVGNFSDWRPVPTFDGQKRIDPTWTAMRPNAQGWTANTRTLAYTSNDEVADIERVREDLFHNDSWLDQNADLEGTKEFEQVRQQTNEIRKLDLDRQSLAAHRVHLIDGLLPATGKKVKGTGTAGGEVINRGLNQFTQIVRDNQAELDGMSHDYMRAFTKLYDQVGKGFRDWNDFHERVMVPVIYRLESEIGRDETGSLREARKAARLLTPAPLPGFDAALDNFLRKTKDLSERMLKVAEDNGVFIKDPELKDQLRRAISKGGFLTAPRALNHSVVNLLMKDLEKTAGWNEGFEKVDVNTDAPTFSSQLEPSFTDDVVERFLAPFIRKPGPSAFLTPDGTGIDAITAEAAWNDAGGNVGAWIDLLGERTGSLDQLANDDTGATPSSKWRRIMLDRIHSRFTMEQRLAHNSGSASNANGNSRPVMHSLMDARLNDDIPPEHMTYPMMDAVSTNTRLGQIAYHASFGRDGHALDAAIQSASAEIQHRMDIRKKIWDSTTSKPARVQAAKDAGYDYNTLDRANEDFRRVKAWDSELQALFSPGGKNGVMGDLHAGVDLMRMMQVLALNSPTSGLMNFSSVLDFPLNYRSAGKASVIATGSAISNVFKRALGSFAQDIFNVVLFDTEYQADVVGPLADRRASNSREWGSKLADIGSRGNYATDGVGFEGFRERVGVNVRKGTRKVMGAIEKGVTPGELLRKGTPTTGPESRFTAITSPFKFANDTIMQSVALTNIKMFELVMKRAITFVNDNPGVLDNPNFKFADADLKMGKTGFLGDANALAWMKQNASDYGLGTIEDLARSAIANKAAGQRLFTRDQAVKLSIMAMDQISGEGGITTRPVESFTNPVMRLAMPMLGWASWRTQKVAEAFKGSDGLADRKTLVNGLKTIALLTLVPAYLFALGMDEWDEWARGKQSSLGKDDSRLGVTQRLSRVGALGIAGDIGFGVLTPLDKESGQRKFTLDSKIFAYSSIASLLTGIYDVASQGLGADTPWASGGRQIAMSLGANGPIQYVQILNQMGLDVSEAEARVIARQNVYSVVRAAAVTAGVPVSRAGGSSTATAQSAWLREMQMAAFAGDRMAFHDAYIKAVKAAREANPDADPQAEVRAAWRGRTPFRPLKDSSPTDAQISSVMAAMDPEGRSILREAMRNYELFSAYLEPSPMDKALAKARKAIDPEARMAARRKAMGLYP